MTTRQIRIACSGKSETEEKPWFMVISTRPYPDDDADLYAVAEDILKDVEVMLGRALAVDVWAVEGNLIWGVTRYGELPA